MANERNIVESPARWEWIEYLPTALAVVDVTERRLIALNPSAARLIGVPRQELVGEPSSRLVPDYLLPARKTVTHWIEQALAGSEAGVEIDLLVETPMAHALRLAARIGPADSSDEFVLLSLSLPDTGRTSGFGGTEDIILGLMSDIGRIVGSSLDLEAVSQRFAISLMHVVPAEHVAILLNSNDGDWLVPVFSTGRFLDRDPVRPSSLGPVSRAINTNSAVLLNEEEIATVRQTGVTTWSESTAGVITACCVPLIAGGECVGVVLLGSALRNAFDPEDLALLEHAGSQVAGAISTVMLHEQLEQGALERDVLANIGRLASAAIGFAGAMPGIAGEVQRFMPISELFVHEPDDVTGELKRSYLWTQSGKETQFDDVGSSEFAAQREVTINGASTVISTVRLPDTGEPVASATAPLRFGGERIGTLTAISARRQSFSAREAAFTSMVAGQISGAVHTARVYRNQQREANLRQSLAQISLTASRDLAPASVFERIANEVAELVAYDLFAIATQTPDRNRMSLRFQMGLDQTLDVYGDLALNESLESFEWRERLVRRLSEFEEYGGLAEQGIEALIEVSIGTRETGATGYMLIGSKAGQVFTERELKMLAQVAVQVTPAIQNATAHEQSVALAEARMSEARAEARNQELEKINDAKSRFLSIVSHELRTPLTSIIAYAELLERNGDGTLNEKQLRQASIINKSASHLKFLISDLLDVSRIESGNLSLQMSTFPISEVVQDVVDLFEPVLAEKHQEFDVHIANESIQLHADRSRIVQIVSNLVENASKYSLPGTVVTVSVHRRGSEVLITVSDQGIGISDDDQRQLFVPFFRANSELTRTEPGTGLGLALVKSIIQLHGGSVSVESKQGEGSTFSVALKATSARQAA